MTNCRVLPNAYRFCLVSAPVVGSMVLRTYCLVDSTKELDLLCDPRPPQSTPVTYIILDEE